MHARHSSGLRLGYLIPDFFSILGGYCAPDYSMLEQEEPLDMSLHMLLIKKFPQREVSLSRFDVSQGVPFW